MDSVDEIGFDIQQQLAIAKMGKIAAAMGQGGEERGAGGVSQFDISPLSGIPVNRRQQYKVTPQSIVASSSKKAAQQEFLADLERIGGSNQHPRKKSTTLKPAKAVSVRAPL